MGWSAAAKVKVQVLVQVGPKSDPSRTQGGPKADPSRTDPRRTRGPRRTQGGPKADGPEADPRRTGPKQDPSTHASNRQQTQATVQYCKRPRPKRKTQWVRLWVALECITH
eukprot:6932-Prorocentrum_minimum.AAC.5